MKREILLIFFNLGVNFGNVFRVLHIVLANCLLHHNMWIHSSSAPRAACSMNFLMSTLNQTDWSKYGFTVHKDKGSTVLHLYYPNSLCARGKNAENIFRMNYTFIYYVCVYGTFTYHTSFLYNVHQLNA